MLEEHLFFPIHQQLKTPGSHFNATLHQILSSAVSQLVPFHLAPSVPDQKYFSILVATDHSHTNIDSSFPLRPCRTMATNRMAYDVLQTAVARQRVIVYDLYGLLEVSPNVDEIGIRRAYEAIVRKLHPEVPSNVVSPSALDIYSVVPLLRSTS